MAFRRSRVAVALYFFLAGSCYATFVARIPTVKHALNINDGVLGLVLFSITFGIVAILPFAGRVIDRFGRRNVLCVSGVVFTAMLVAAGAAGGVVQIMVALTVFGVAFGLVDVAMNAEASRLEHEHERPLMSSFHAFYSIGELVAAAAAIFFATTGIGLVPSFLVFAVPLAVGAVLVAPWIKTGRATSPVEQGHLGETVRKPLNSYTFLVWLLAALATCGQVIEGAVAEWSGVYLRDSIHSSVGVAVYGYTAFALATTVGRLLGDRVEAKVGSRRLFRSAAAVAVLGFAAVLIVPTPAAVIAGFGVIGFGMSVIVPQLYAAAGRQDPTAADRNMALVAGVSNVGQLGGPVVIGALAAGMGLPVALLLPALMAVVLVCSARVLRTREKTALGVAG